MRLGCERHDDRKNTKKECFKLKYLVKESVRQVVDVVGP